MHYPFPHSARAAAAPSLPEVFLLWFLVAYVAMLTLASRPAQALEKSKPTTVISGLLNIDSMEMLEYNGKRHMWMTGWMDKKRMGVPGIFHTVQNAEGWSQPAVAFDKPGYGIGSPSIIKHPYLEEYHMYYTQRPPADPHNPKAKRSEQVGLAVGKYCTDSKDGSNICWEDRSQDQPFIGDRNGFNKDGAKDASAVVVGEELWIYYKSNAPSSLMLRTRVDLSDNKKIATEPLTLQQYHPHLKKWLGIPYQQQNAITNLEVTQMGDKYVMFSNAFSYSGITRFESTNGVNFYYKPEDRNAAFLTEPNVQLKSPHVVPLINNEFQIYAVHAAPNAKCSLGPENFCGQSVKAWRVKMEEPTEE